MSTFYDSKLNLYPIETNNIKDDTPLVQTNININTRKINQIDINDSRYWNEDGKMIDRYYQFMNGMDGRIQICKNKLNNIQTIKENMNTIEHHGGGGGGRGAAGGGGVGRSGGSEGKNTDGLAIARGEIAGRNSDRPFKNRDRYFRDGSHWKNRHYYNKGYWGRDYPYWSSWYYTPYVYDINDKQQNLFNFNNIFIFILIVIIIILLLKK